jgi:hypothetical protein
MRARWVWVGALLLYGVFSLWYNNWRAPLSPAEIDHYLEVMSSRSASSPERITTVRAFLEADDGGEFLMLNLMRLTPEPIAMPGAAAPQSAEEVMEGYTGYLLPALVARGGHPAFLGQAAAGYVEDWGVEPNPGWSSGAVVRYRSRRDMMEVATDPAFEPAHAFKLAAMPNTLAFPLRPAFVVVGPRIWVALLLALLAALTHLMLQARRS